MHIFIQINLIPPVTSGTFNSFTRISPGLFPRAIPGLFPGLRITVLLGRWFVDLPAFFGFGAASLGMKDSVEEMFKSVSECRRTAGTSGARFLTAIIDCTVVLSLAQPLGPIGYHSGWRKLG